MHKISVKSNLKQLFPNWIDGFVHAYFDDLVTPGKFPLNTRIDDSLLAFMNTLEAGTWTYYWFCDCKNEITAKFDWRDIRCDFEFKNRHDAVNFKLAFG